MSNVPSPGHIEIEMPSRPSWLLAIQFDGRAVPDAVLSEGNQWTSARGN